MLKLEVKRLRQECDLLAKDSRKSTESKKEVLRLQRDLLKERARAR